MQSFSVFCLFLLSATPYHVIPCNFRLLFCSSIYSVYSCFFPKNLMKTGIGQSKYCIPQPFSRCLISLCSSLFGFNSMTKVMMMKIVLFYTGARCDSCKYRYPASRYQDVAYKRSRICQPLLDERKTAVLETHHNVICCPLDVVSNFFSFFPKLHQKIPSIISLKINLEIKCD